MSEVSAKAPRFVLAALLCVSWANLALAQQTLPPETVPSNFTADAVFAARIRSLLLPYTKPATGHYALSREVMETLLRQLAVPPDRAKFAWDVRIAKGAGNVFSSPDGTIFVDEELADLLASRNDARIGSSAGLWAAALSHEIAHVVRRDWARRYLFQRSLNDAGASQLTIGDAGVFSGSWVDARGASAQLASFCQAMELDADAEGLMLMTRAGFAPDFVPALHHLLEAQPGQADGNIFDPSHPRWEEREQRLQKLYVAAGREFDRRWPERYASPGGNPPIVVYTGSPSVRRDASGETEVLIPLHCQNLVGAVEVVLRFTAPNSHSASELRQLTGCTSDRTLVTFAVPSFEAHKGRLRVQAEVSVLDDNGAILSRSVVPLAAR